MTGSTDRGPARGDPRPSCFLGTDEQECLVGDSTGRCRSGIAATGQPPAAPPRASRMPGRKQSPSGPTVRTATCRALVCSADRRVFRNSSAHSVSDFTSGAPESSERLIAREIGASSAVAAISARACSGGAPNRKWATADVSRPAAGGWTAAATAAAAGSNPAPAARHAASSSATSGACTANASRQAVASAAANRRNSRIDVAATTAPSTSPAGRRRATRRSPDPPRHRQPQQPSPSLLHRYRRVRRRHACERPGPVSAA